MAEFCPLRTGMPIDSPDFCRQECEDLWDEAVKNSNYDGGYDWYNDYSHNPESVKTEYDEPCSDQDVEFGADSLSPINLYERRYVIVDACGQGHNLGEQGFKFTCPHPLGKVILAED